MDRRNRAVPSPILRETDPIDGGGFDGSWWRSIGGFRLMGVEGGGGALSEAHLGVSVVIMMGFCFSGFITNTNSLYSIYVFSIYILLFI